MRPLDSVEVHCSRLRASAPRAIVSADNDAASGFGGGTLLAPTRSAPRAIVSANNDAIVLRRHPERSRGTATSLPLAMRMPHVTRAQRRRRGVEGVDGERGGARSPHRGAHSAALVTGRSPQRAMIVAVPRQARDDRSGAESPPALRPPSADNDAIARAVIPSEVEGQRPASHLAMTMPHVTRAQRRRRGVEGGDGERVGARSPIVALTRLRS